MNTVEAMMQREIERLTAHDQFLADAKVEDRK